MSTKKKNAYVTLFMHNPNYIYGTITLGYSLKLTNTKYDLVCMVTDDLYEKYNKYLELVYDKIVKIPYVNFNEHSLTIKKHKEIYNEWYNISYTKWECLKLTEYNKICFLDSDLLILKNIDHLFEIDAPAACFVNYWSEFGNNKNYYRNIKYGKKIPNEIIKNALNSSFVLVAHCVILEPNINEYTEYKKFVFNNFIPSKRCISMLDEQAITAFYMTLNKQWTQLHYIYNTIPWKMSITNMKKSKDKIVLYQPYILHYFNKVKPWMDYNDEWIDIYIWYEFYNNLIKEFPDVKEIHNLSEISINEHLAKYLNSKTNKQKKLCVFCNFIHYVFNTIEVINKDCSIIIKDLPEFSPDILIDLHNLDNNHKLIDCLFLKNIL